MEACIKLRRIHIEKKKEKKKLRCVRSAYEYRRRADLYCTSPVIINSHHECVVIFSVAANIRGLLDTPALCSVEEAIRRVTDRTSVSSPSAPSRKLKACYLILFADL